MTTLANPDNQFGRLVAARQVQGAKVFNTALDEVGSIEDVMIDTASGRIAYAIVTTGGFLGMLETHYPLPWEKLR
ncbi:MAG TPA: PRC-barrel domain-containing protein, partial [Rhodopila sp.]|nr:PRC-barrel domain-containing protein [Rhodopila sp.]